MLPGKSFAQAVEENLKALRIGCRQDQERAGSIHRANRSVEVNKFTNELRGNRWSDTWRSPTRPGTVHPTEASFVGEHDPQPTTLFCGDPFVRPEAVAGAPFMARFVVVSGSAPLVEAAGRATRSRSLPQVDGFRPGITAGSCCSFKSFGHTGWQRRPDAWGSQNEAALPYFALSRLAALSVPYEQILRGLYD